MMDITLQLVAIYIVICVITAAIGTLCGYGGRSHWHQQLPWHDPWYMLVVYPAELIFCILVGAGVFHIGDNGFLAALIIMTFDGFYLLGYALCRPNDVQYVNTPELETLSPDSWPLIHYFREVEQKYEDGKTEIVNMHYFMPQTLRGALRSCVGAGDPLDAPYYMVKITRTFKQRRALKKVRSENVVDVALYIKTPKQVDRFKIWTRKIKDANKNVIRREPVYLLHMISVSHKQIFPQTINQMPDAVFTRNEAYGNCILEMDQTSAELRRMQVQMETMTNDAGRDYIKMIIDSREDAAGVSDELEEIVESETKLRRPVKEEDSKPVENKEEYDGSTVS